METTPKWTPGNERWKKDFETLHAYLKGNPGLRLPQAIANCFGRGEWSFLIWSKYMPLDRKQHDSYHDESMFAPLEEKPKK